MSGDGAPAPAPTERPVEPLERLVAIGLAAGRLAIGAALWTAPQRSGRALGFASLDETGLALARVAASRDLVLGVWQLSALDRDRLRQATVGVAAADAGDAITFALALRGSDATRTAGLRGLPAAAAATVAGAWLAAHLGHRRG